MELSTLYCGKRPRQRTGLACWILLVACCLVASPFRAQEHGASSRQVAAQQHEQEHQSGEHGESPLAPLWKWLNFSILFGGLGWYLRKPLGEFLRARVKGIEEGLANAREAKQDALSKTAEIQSRLARLDEEIREIRAQAGRDSAEERARLLESARLEAQKILDLASREIEGLKKSARLELKTYVAELAVKLAEERLRTSVGADEDRKIIQKFIDSLDSRPS
jgi:F-type H+-transporting ATPase subunit b